MKHVVLELKAYWRWFLSPLVMYHIVVWFVKVEISEQFVQEPDCQKKKRSNKITWEWEGREQLLKSNSSEKISGC